MSDAILNTKSNFSANHFLLIAGVAGVLATFTLVGQPQWLKQITEKKPTAVESKYYAYVPDSTSPQVLGADSKFDGPSVINEDGSISPAVDIGSVLGVSTEDIQVSMQDIPVNTMPTTVEKVQTYFSYMEKEEEDLNAVDFGTALTSSNPAVTAAQVQKLQTFINHLKTIAVPTDLVKLHKLRLIQYQAAMKVLQNYSQLSSNPELVNQQLGIFLETQSEQNDELLALEQKYNLQGPIASDSNINLTTP